MVSTVYLGLDHSFMGGPPMIFESMVFGPGASNDWDMRRYSTEEQAIKGHWEMVKEWRHPGLRKLLEIAWDEVKKAPDWSICRRWLTVDTTLLNRFRFRFQVPIPWLRYDPLPRMQRAMFSFDPAAYVRSFRQSPPPSTVGKLRAAVLSLYFKSKRRVK
jgi:hypothetical protein